MSGKKSIRAKLTAVRRKKVNPVAEVKIEEVVEEIVSTAAPVVEEVVVETPVVEEVIVEDETVAEEVKAAPKKRAPRKPKKVVDTDEPQGK